MKKVTLLFAALALLSMSVIGQPVLQWRFANETVFDNGTDIVLQFDVELSCDVAATYHSSLQLYYDYNVLGFGTNIVANNKVSFTRLALMQGQFASVDKYIINNFTDNTDHTFAILTEASFIIAGATFMNEVPQLPNWGGYFQFTIIVADQNQMAGVAFRPDLMDGGNYYVDATHPTETKYGIPPLFAGAYQNGNLPTILLTPPTVGKTWNGNLSTDWFDGGNWTPAGVPVAGDDVVIPPVDAWFPVIIGGSATITSVNVNAGAELQIGATGALTVTGLTTVDGRLYIIDGSFIDNGVAGGGLFQYDRYISPEIVANNDEWHYISAPVNNAVSGDFAGYMLKYWDRDFNGGWWIDVDPCGYTPGVDCYPPSNLAVGLNVAQGYSVKNWYPCDELGLPLVVPSTGATVEFGGDMLNGVPVPTGATPNATNLANITNMNTGNYTIPMAGASNWVLMGNPYPSGWDYDLFFFGPNFAAANIADAIYFWDGTAMQYATYINGISTNGGDNEVPPTQGFLFDALGAGTMNFTNAERIHTNIPFWKEEPAKMIRLTVSGEKYSDETVVRFNEEATTMYDVHFDAKKLFSTSTLVPSLYTKSNFDLSINSMPQAEAVPVYFSGPEGYYTISAITDLGLVYLEDKETGAFHDLTTSYEFYNAGGAEGRFVLHFGLSNELANNGYVIYSYANNIYVNNLNNVSGTIAVYTMMGQEVQNVNLVGGLNIISMSEQNTTYIVKVLGSTATVSEKVYIR